MQLRACDGAVPGPPTGLTDQAARQAGLRGGLAPSTTHQSPKAHPPATQHVASRSGTAYASTTSEGAGSTPTQAPPAPQARGRSQAREECSDKARGQYRA